MGLYKGTKNKIVSEGNVAEIVSFSEVLGGVDLQTVGDISCIPISVGTTAEQYIEYVSILPTASMTVIPLELLNKWNLNLDDILIPDTDHNRSILGNLVIAQIPFIRFCNYIFLNLTAIIDDTNTSKLPVIGRDVLDLFNVTYISDRYSIYHNARNRYNTYYIKMTLKDYDNKLFNRKLQANTATGVLVAREFKSVFDEYNPVSSIETLHPIYLSNLDDKKYLDQMFGNRIINASIELWEHNEQNDLQINKEYPQVNITKFTELFDEYQDNFKGQERIKELKPFDPYNINLEALEFKVGDNNQDIKQRTSYTPIASNNSNPNLVTFGSSPNVMHDNQGYLDNMYGQSNVTELFSEPNNHTCSINMDANTANEVYNRYIKLFSDFTETLQTSSVIESNIVIPVDIPKGFPLSLMLGLMEELNRTFGLPPSGGYLRRKCKRGLYENIDIDGSITFFSNRSTGEEGYTIYMSNSDSEENRCTAEDIHNITIPIEYYDLHNKLKFRFTSSIPKDIT